LEPEKQEVLVGGGGEKQGKNTLVLPSLKGGNRTGSAMRKTANMAVEGVEKSNPSAQKKKNSQGDWLGSREKE